MSLTPEETQHIAILARIGFTSKELEGFRSQLKDILKSIQMLEEIDTDGVPPTIQPIPLESVMREDVPEPSMSRKDTLANAPRKEEGYFRVRAVLE